MLTIQDAGKQILTGQPGKFYCFLGEECGIKTKYIDSLAKHYGEVKEVESAKAVIDLMNTKRLIPLSPAVYVVRYDEEFLATLGPTSESVISSCKIIGTLVCVYELPKHCSKCAKYLANYSVSFDKVSKQFLMKYLKSDFPSASDELIKFILTFKDDYMSAWHICNAMSYASTGEGYSSQLLAKTFNCVNDFSEKGFKVGVAAKDFRYAKSVLDNYSGQLDSLFYSILNLMLELDRITDNSYLSSDFRPYADRWTKADIYYMFSNTYEELKRSRSISSYDVKSGLLYLISLLPFNAIIPPEVLS